MLSEFDIEGARARVPTTRPLAAQRRPLSDASAEEQSEEVSDGGRAVADGELAYRAPQRGSAGQQSDHNPGPEQRRPHEDHRDEQCDGARQTGSVVGFVRRIGGEILR